MRAVPSLFLSRASKKGLGEGDELSAQQALLSYMSSWKKATSYSIRDDAGRCYACDRKIDGLREREVRSLAGLTGGGGHQGRER